VRNMRQRSHHRRFTPYEDAPLYVPALYTIFSAEIPGGIACTFTQHHFVASCPHMCHPATGNIQLHNLNTPVGTYRGTSSYGVKRRKYCK
ncbi:MAG: hypothetical protein K2G12_11005, partial [Prevotella sp.]|nr:hypothetical protein [Prevotella sp.]